jgi:Flp pilus assembly protein TadD
MIVTAFNALQGGNFAYAEQISRQLLARSPNDEGALMVLAMSLDAQSRFDEALPAFQQLAEAYPRAEHWLNLGNLQRAQGQIGPARISLERSAALDPTLGEPLQQLGLIEFAAGLFHSAGHHLLAAHRLQPQDPALRAQAARACHQAGDAETTAALLQDWQTWAAGDPAVLSDVAWTLLDAGDIETTDAVLRQAELAAPDSAAVLAKRAAFLERTNRVEEAREVLARIRTSDSALNEEVEILRAQLTARGGDQEEAYRLHAALAGDETVARRHIELFFSLARLSDQRSDPEQAMQWLQRGHTIQMEQLRQSSAQVQAEADAMLVRPTLAGTADYAQWTAVSAPSAEESPIFVVGFPRSGTTVLETILDAHPQLSCMDEQPYLHNLSIDLRQQGLVYPQDLGKLDDAACARLREQYWKQVHSHGRVTPGRRLIDKNPLNMTRIALIKRIFPAAKVILALRDPRDVVLSNYMQLFRAPAYVRMCETLQSTAEGYAVAFDTWNEVTRLLPLDLLQTRHEDMVEDVEGCARKLCEFLGLEWSANMVAFHENALRRGYIRTPSYAQVVEPVNRKGIGRWQRYARWLEPAQARLAPFVQQFGYAAGGD